MMWNCLLWSEFEPCIIECNDHSVKINTGFQLSIMYTRDENLKERLIEWQKRFDDFSTVVRRLLITLHKGLELTDDELEKPKKTYEQLTTAVENATDRDYLSQYEKNIQSILSIFQNAVKIT